MSEEKNALEKAPLREDELLVPAGYHNSSSANRYGAYPGENDYSLNGNVQLQELWRRISKHKWLIFFLTVIVTTVVAIEVFRTKSVYMATATVEMEKENRTLFRSGDVVVESEEADYGYYVSTAMKTKIRRIQSRPLLEEVVVTLKLDQNPEFLDVTERRTIWEAIRTISGVLGNTKKSVTAGTPAESPVVQVDGLLRRSQQESERLAPYVDTLSGLLIASPVDETRMLAISVEHTNPGLAATIANTTARVFIEESYKDKTQNITSTSDWLNARTRELQAKVQQAEQELANYTSSNNIFSTDGKENLTIDKLSGLHAQVMKAETERLLKQSLYEEVKQGRVAQLPEAFSDPKNAALQNRLGELSTQAAQYVGRYGPDNPKVIDLKKQIAAIEKQISESRSSLEEKLKADYERAVRDAQALNEALAKAKGEAVQQNQAAIRFGLLRQEVETAKTLYTDFLNKTNQAGLQKAMQGKNMNVVEPAVTSRVPIRPNRGRVILIGLLLSLGLGVVIALVIEYVDNTVKTADDVSRTLNLPTLAVIPAMANPQRRFFSVGKKKESHTALAAKGAEPISNFPVAHLAESLMNKSYSLLAEAYCGLRTSILLSTAGNPPKILLFTSSQPGEGKTTTTINTGISLVQLGAKVLIIDADMRRPTVNKSLGVAQSPGLSSYLVQDIDVDTVIRELSIQNLSIMPSGPIPPNPTELLSSDRMKELLRLLADRYDHILIDSPPLVNVSDPIILSTLVSGVIFVVQSSFSKRAIVSRARQELANVGAKIIGVVLNNVNLKGDGYDDYFYNRYYSDYKHNEKKAGVNGD
jgi:succinoglycan biosynthesis transport protein ExoP